MRNLKCVGAILSAILMSIIFMITMLYCFDNKAVTVDRAMETNSPVVLSYADVFEAYYDYAEETVLANGNEMCSYEEFCDKYYSSGMDIAEYTEAVIQVLTADSCDDEDGGIALATDISEDEYYILSSTTYDYTPLSEFKEEPIYFFVDYSELNEEDIIYETNTSLGTGHNALVYDLDKSGYYGTYIQTIEAVANGVQYGFLDDARMVEFGVVILRVTGNVIKLSSWVTSFMGE